MTEPKPLDCTCDWPRIKARNMVGHPRSCRAYERLHDAMFGGDRREYQEAIGTRVREIRESIGLRQAELARRSGLSQQHVCGIEKGRIAPSVWTVRLLCGALGVAIGDLLDDD